MLHESCGRVRDRIEQAGWVKDIIRPTESTKLGPWGLTETEPQSKEHSGIRPRPPTRFLADMKLGLPVGPPTIGAGGVYDSVTCHWLPFSINGLSSWVLVGEDVFRPMATRCHRVRWHSKGLSFLFREGEEQWGRDCKCRTGRG